MTTSSSVWQGRARSLPSYNHNLSLARRSNGLNLSSPKTALGDAYSDQGVVFAGPLGEWLNPMMVTRRAGSLGKQVGYPDAKPHNMRHFHCTVGLEQNANIAVMSQRLGHANPTITMRTYAHVLPSWQQDAADDFARTMAESQKGGGGPVAGDGAIDTRAA